jgi:aryl-alcohol dehydrogenase-like predicted oxidoreductase
VAIHEGVVSCGSPWLDAIRFQQNHYNLLNREEKREMMPLCQAEGIGVLPWSPLARGRLARPW